MTALLELGDKVLEPEKIKLKFADRKTARLHTANQTTYFPDVSEFQADVNWAQVTQWNGGAAIIRAAYGAGHVDRAWYGGARRDAFWKNGGKVLGIYQYLVASQDPVAQAAAFVQIVGALKPGEFAICDLEEGAGNQLARFNKWRAYVDAHLHYPGYTGAWLYSGDYFFKNHGLMPVANSKTHTWVAAYQNTEPTDVPHSVWQCNDKAHVPGIGGGVDLSLYHGNVQDLHNLIVTGGPQTPPPAPKPPVKPIPKPAPVINRAQIKSLQKALGLRSDGFWWKDTDAAFLHERARAHNHFGTDKAEVTSLQNVVKVRADGDWGNSTDRALLSLRAADLNK